MSMGIEELIEKIKALPPEEQRRLRAAIADPTPSRMAGSDDMTAEEQFKQRLFEAGIIAEIKRPERNLHEAQKAFLSYQPIEICGKPISETIIEDRR